MGARYGGRGHGGNRSSDEPRSLCQTLESRTLFACETLTDFDFGELGGAWKADVPNPVVHIGKQRILKFRLDEDRSDLAIEVRPEHLQPRSIEDRRVQIMRDDGDGCFTAADGIVRDWIEFLGSTRQLNALALPSGTYFVRLSAAPFLEGSDPAALGIKYNLRARATVAVAREPDHDLGPIDGAAPATDSGSAGLTIEVDNSGGEPSNPFDRVIQFRLNSPLNTLKIKLTGWQDSRSFGGAADLRLSLSRDTDPVGVYDQHEVTHRDFGNRLDVPDLVDEKVSSTWTVPDLVGGQYFLHVLLDNVKNYTEGLIKINYEVELTPTPAPLPDVRVACGETSVQDGDDIPSVADCTDFDGAAERTFTVKNTGGATLTLGSVSTPPGFTLKGTDLPEALAPGASAAFTIAISSGMPYGRRSGTLQFGTNAAGKNPFDFTIAADVEQPLCQCSVSGTVYEDANVDGQRQVAEKPLANRIIYLDIDRDGAPDEGEPLTRSDGDGRYVLAAPNTGKFYVRQRLSPQARATSPIKAVHKVTFGTGQLITGKDFGITSSARISGSVFHDVDADGSKSPHERGVAGLKVYIDSDDDGRLDRDEMRIRTDADGQWTFDNLKAGTYQLRIVAGSKWRQTTPRSGILKVTVAKAQLRDNRHIAITKRA